MNNRIGTDKLHMQGLFKDFRVDGVESMEYTIFYRNIIKSLQFLIVYKRFKQDLLYSPVCQYASDLPLDLDIKNDDGKMYGEMNTEDWW